MDDTKPPAPFEALARLAAGPASIEKAKVLSEALNAVPQLQSWLREQRQHTVRTLLWGQGMSKEELAPHLGVTPQRVADIASGHTRSRAPRRRPPTTDSAD